MSAPADGVAGGWRIYARAAADWLLVLALAIANGALREAVLVPLAGATGARFASGVLLIACILAVAAWRVPRLGASTPAVLWRVGALWLALTLAFEFAFGALVQRKSANELLAPYAFAGGDLWPLVLVATFVGPRLMGGRRAHPQA